MTAHTHEHAPDVDCTAAAQQLWDYLDEELTPERMDALHAHFTKCRPCLRHAEWGREFLAALRDCRDGNSRAPDELRSKIKGLLKGEGYCLGD